jgi:putative peptidoglycan lipid II flippase
MRFDPAVTWSHPDVKEYLRLTLPLMLGLTMTFSTEFFFRFFGSYLPSGSIAVLNFSLRVMLILVGIFGQAVGTASFPYMARLAAENQMEELNRLLNRTLSYMALVMPLAALFSVLSPEVVGILFQRGRFDSVAAQATADVLVWFLAGASAFAAYSVIVRGYYAIGNTLFPALFGSGAVLISIPLYPLGMAWMGAEGVALAVSVAGILQAVVLFAIWSRRSRNIGQKEVFRFYLKMALVSAGLALVLSPVRKAAVAWVDASDFSGSLIVSAVVGLVFVGLMLAVGYTLKIREINQAAEYVWGKLRIKK